MAAEKLRAEARYLNRFLFDESLPEVLEHHYVEAHQQGVVTSTSVDIDKIVERRLDAEAIELVLRRRDPMNALTQKMQVLVYLAEAQRKYYDYFISERDRPVFAFFRLSWGVMRSVVKLVRGLYLTRVHRLV